MQKLDLFPCKAPLWANSGHGQTIWGHFLKSPELASSGQKLKVDLPDGDRLFCYVFEGTSNFVVSVYHGLSGNSTSDYMQRTAMLAQRFGHTVVLVNHRGAGDGILEARRPYHSGSTEDMSAVLKVLKNKYPGKKQITVGFSLSGNISLALLGGYKGSEKPDGAITVNAPLALEKGAHLLKTGMNRLYDLRFVLRLRKLIQEKHRLGVIQERYKVPPWATVFAMDEIYTAPAGGFRDRADYYDSCSSIHYVHNIQTPTYILTAEDDPFIDVQDYRSAPFSKTCQVHIEKRGGHMGYIAKASPQGGRHWLDYYLKEALSALATTLSASK